MLVSFNKNHRLSYTPTPTREYPEGSPHSYTFKLPAQDGSTFTKDAILIGRLETDDAPWTPVSPSAIAKYSEGDIAQKRHQLATWVDENNDGVIDQSEYRSFDNCIGDVNPNRAGGYAAVTTDLSLSTGQLANWYISEDIGVLKTLD